MNCTIKSIKKHEQNAVRHRAIEVVHWKRTIKIHIYTSFVLAVNCGGIK